MSGLFKQFKIIAFHRLKFSELQKLCRLWSHSHLLPNPSCALCCRHTGVPTVSLLCSWCRSSAFLTSILSFFYWSLPSRLPISSSLRAYAVLHVHSKHGFSLGLLHLQFPLPGTLSFKISAGFLTSLRTLHTLPYHKTVSTHCHFLFFFVYFSSQHLSPCGFVVVAVHLLYSSQH